MSEATVQVFTQAGQPVGRFINPKVEMVSEHHYYLSGRFINPDGSVPDRIPYNPEVMPYVAELPASGACPHQKLTRVYVERGRQPVQMMGYCL